MYMYVFSQTALYLVDHGMISLLMFIIQKDLEPKITCVHAHLCHNQSCTCTFVYIYSAYM